VEAVLQACEGTHQELVVVAVLQLQMVHMALLSAAQQHLSENVSVQYKITRESTPQLQCQCTKQVEFSNKTDY